MRKLGVAAALLGMLCIVPSTGFAQVKGVYYGTSGKFGPFKMGALVPNSMIFRAFRCGSAPTASALPTRQKTALNRLSLWMAG